MQKNKSYVFIALVIFFSFTSCYHRQGKSKTPSNFEMVDGKYAIDSVTTFERTHHYSQNYNFVVKSDSLMLLRQQPEELLYNLATDSIPVFCRDHLVVVDIRILKNDSNDSVWVQVARDQDTFGWVHETVLLKETVPDDPISQFISIFSDVHLLIFLVIIVVIGVSYLLHGMFVKNAKVVHFNDICSFYPTLLALIVATSATFYSSIQLFAPDIWRCFYFHPSLNPFAVSGILSIFLLSVWLLVIVCIATIDDVYHKLEFGEATLYLCGLAGICAANYIIFSVLTLYYIGYLLLGIYIAFAIHIYYKKNIYNYVCGNCGARMNKKGQCPKCGAWNE